MKKLLYVSIFLFPVIIMIIFPKWTVDDAYIGYRYAENLAQHGQLTWNVGETPVEGYTGIAFPTVMAGFIKLGLQPEVGSHVMGVVAYFLGLIMLILLCREVGIKTVGQIVVGALFASTPILFTHAFSGLETMWFLAFLLLSLYLLAKNIHDRTHRRWAEPSLVISLLILSFIRPEGVVIAALAMSAYLFVLCRQRERFSVFVFECIMCYAIPAVGYFMWRYGYYGLLLPNTYYVKSADHFSINSFIELSRFIMRYFLAPLAVCLLLIVIDFDQLVSKFIHRKLTRQMIAAITVMLVLFIFAIVLLVQYAHSHLNMNYAYRFYIPILPLVWVSIGCMIEIGWRMWHESKINFSRRYYLLLGIFVVAGIYQTLFYSVKLREEIKFAREEKAMIETTHSNVGKWINQVIPPEEWLVVYMDAGAIPYFAKLKTIDFGELNDTKLTQGNLSSVERINYFFSFHPGVAVFTSDEPDRIVSTEEVDMIMKDPRFGQYTLAKTYSTDSSISIKYSEFIFVRNDLLKNISL